MFERISVKYNVPGHTYMSPDRAFASLSRELKNNSTLGDPRELVDAANECKNIHAQWLEREDHVAWDAYLEQFYNVDTASFMHVDGVPLLMASRSVFCFV